MVTEGPREIPRELDLRKVDASAAEGELRLRAAEVKSALELLDKARTVSQEVLKLQFSV